MSPQGQDFDGWQNFCVCCANIYLGLGDGPPTIEALKHMMKGICRHASVRFIYGTQDIHKVRKRISDFRRTDDTILYSSCFDANGGLFEILTADDAVIGDQVNHASIIDVRLCKTKRFI